MTKNGRGMDMLGNGGRSANTVHVHHDAPKETRINPKNGEARSIDYWHEYAITLSNGVDGLIKDRDENTRIMIERRCINAGLRAVMRELLKDIRAKDPNNKLLDKKYRDRIFAEFEQEEMKKVLAKNPDLKPWSPRERPLENTSE